MSSCGAGPDEPLAVPISRAPPAARPLKCPQCKVGIPQTSLIYPHSSPANGNCFPCCFTYVANKVRANVRRFCGFQMTSAIAINFDASESARSAYNLLHFLSNPSFKKRLLFRPDIIYIDCSEIFQYSTEDSIENVNSLIDMELISTAKFHSAKVYRIPFSALFAFDDLLNDNNNNNNSIDFTQYLIKIPNSNTTGEYYRFPSFPQARQRLISLLVNYLSLENISVTKFQDFLVLLSHQLLSSLALLFPKCGQIMEISSALTAAASVLQELSKNTRRNFGQMTAFREFKYNPSVQFMFPFKDIPTRLCAYLQGIPTYSLNKENQENLPKISLTHNNSNDSIASYYSLANINLKLLFAFSHSNQRINLNSNTSNSSSPSAVSPSIRFSFPFPHKKSPFSLSTPLSNDLNYLSIQFLSRLDLQFQNSVFNILRTGAKIDVNANLKQLISDFNGNSAESNTNNQTQDSSNSSSIAAAAAPILSLCKFCGHSFIVIASSLIEEIPSADNFLDFLCVHCVELLQHAAKRRFQQNNRTFESRLSDLASTVDKNVLESAIKPGLDLKLFPKSVLNRIPGRFDPDELARPEDSNAESNEAEISRSSNSHSQSQSGKNSNRTRHPVTSEKAEKREKMKAQIQEFLLE